MAVHRQKPLALVVFLENVGHIGSLPLPSWVKSVVDYATEEYAKLLLHLYGAHRRYDQVFLLEDALATGNALASTLLSSSQTHTVDVLLLVHGYTGELVGHRGEERVGRQIFEALQRRYSADPACLDLRAIYGLNCYGASLTSTWLDLGAEVVNGAVGVNWFPEPSLSVFLRNWLRGRSYSTAVVRSNTIASRWWQRLLSPRGAKATHPWVLSSRQIVAGRADITIDS